MKNSISESGMIRIPKADALDRLALLEERKDLLRVRSLNEAINRSTAAEYDSGTYLEDIDMPKDEYRKIFFDEIVASYVGDRGENILGLIGRVRRFIEETGIDVLHIPFGPDNETISITKEMNAQKIIRLISGSTNIYVPDFKSKKDSNTKNPNHGPYYAKEASSTSENVEAIKKIKKIKSKSYDFENPDETNKGLWFSFFDSFATSLKEDFISNYIFNVQAEELEKVFDMLIGYYRKYFESLYDFDEKGERIALNLISENTSRVPDAEVLIYEYLLDTSVEDRRLDLSFEKKMAIISDKFRDIYSKKRLKIYRLIGEYGDFFLERFAESEQITSLMQAISFYSQKRYDSIFDEIWEAIDDGETNF